MMVMWDQPRWLAFALTPTQANSPSSTRWIPASTFPPHLTTDRNGRFLLTAYYGGGWRHRPSAR